jgi:hypothetical protein
VFWVRCGRSVLTPACEFEVSVRSRHGKENAFVALMVVEPPDFRQAEIIPIEPNDLVESVRMPCNT